MGGRGIQFGSCRCVCVCWCVYWGGDGCGGEVVVLWKRKEPGDSSVMRAR